MGICIFNIYDTSTTDGRFNYGLPIRRYMLETERKNRNARVQLRTTIWELDSFLFLSMFHEKCIPHEAWGQDDFQSICCPLAGRVYRCCWRYIDNGINTYPVYAGCYYQTDLYATYIDPPNISLLRNISHFQSGTMNHEGPIGWLADNDSLSQLLLSNTRELRIILIVQCFANSINLGFG